MVLVLGALSGCGAAEDNPPTTTNTANSNQPAAGVPGQNTSPAATGQNTSPAAAGQNTSPAESAAGGTKASGTLRATPNPIQVCGNSAAGKTTLQWDVKGAGRVQLRVGSPDGAMMVDSTQTQGKAETGDWVIDGSKFFLLDASGARPATLGSVTVKVTKEGCR